MFVPHRVVPCAREAATAERTTLFAKTCLWDIWTCQEKQLKRERAHHERPPC